MVSPALLFAIALVLQIPDDLAVEVIAVTVATAICFLVVGDALAIQREANSMYAHMVADGLISTPTSYRQL